MSCASPKVRASSRAWRLSVRRAVTEAAINASLGGDDSDEPGGNTREIDAIEEKTGMTSELRSRSFLNLGMSIFGSLNLDSGLVREKTHGPLADTSWFGR